MTEDPIRVGVRNGRIFQAVSPESVERYLAAAGWVVVDEWSGRFCLWSGPYGPNEQVLVPFSQSFADYAIRLSELVETLQRLEERSELELLASLLGDHELSMQFNATLRALSALAASVGNCPVEEAH